MTDRTERVILTLVDNASRPMAEFAASTEAASRALHDLDGTSTSAGRSQDSLNRSTSRTSQALRQTDSTARAATNSTNALARAQAQAASASDKVEAATRREANAAGSLRVAQAQLNDLRQRGNASSTQTLSVEERVATATRNHAAAVTALARAEESLRGANANVVTAEAEAARAANNASDAFRRGRSDIDSYSGRLGLLGRAAVSLGPALLPIAATAVPAMTSLAAGLGAAAGAAGTLMLAFHGMSDAFTALNAYQLEPTAENLRAMQQAMDKIGPSGAQFVRYIDSLSGSFSELQRTAQAGIFPGFEKGIASLMTMLPTVRDVVSRISIELGNLGEKAGSSLAHDADLQRFFDYIRTDAAPTLDAFARATGNFAAGLANSLTAFAPLTRSFTSGLLSMSQSFRNWTSDTSNFQSFIDYVQRVGPQVGEFFTSLTQAVASVAKAMAPWGSVVLPALTGVVKVFTAIEASPIGPVLTSGAAAMIAFSTATKLATRAFGAVRPQVSSFSTAIRSVPRDLQTVASGFMTAGEETERETTRMSEAAARLRTAFSGAAIGGAAVGGMLALSDAAGRATGAMKGLETVTGTALLGFAASGGNPVGAAIGGIAGALSLLGGNAQDTAADIGDLSTTFDTLTGAATTATQTMVTNNLAAQGFGEYAKGLGLSLTTVTQAVMGNGTAMDQVNAKLKQYEDGAGVAGGAFANLGTKIAKQAAQYKQQAQAAKDAAATNNELNGTATQGASAWQRAATALQNYINKQHELHDTTLSNLDAQFAYAQSVKDAQEQADKGTKGLDRWTAAGRANEQVLSAMTKQYDAQGQGIKNSIKGYDNAKDRIAQLGHQMGLTGQQIKNFQDQLDKPKTLDVNEVPAAKKIADFKKKAADVAKTRVDPTLNANPNPALNQTAKVQDQLARLDHTTANPKVTADVGDALRGLGSVHAYLDSLHDRNIHVNVTTTTNSRLADATANAKPKGAGADGLTIPGQRNPYGDKVLIWAAPGEQLITNRHGEADRFRADRAAGRIPAYADGGTVGATTGLDPQTRKDLGIIAATLVGGIVHAIGHGTGALAAASHGLGAIPGEAGRTGFSTNPNSRWSPLYGIGDKRISAAELGARLSNNLTDQQIKALGKSLDDLNKKQLKKFGKALDDAATTVKARADAAKTTLDNEVSKRSDLASTVAQSLTVDAFAVPDQTTTWNSAASAATGPTRASVRAALTTQASNARALSGYIATIRKRLGSGPQADAFISWILSQSDPVGDAKIFATESATALTSDQRLYASSTAAVNAAGAAGGAIYNNEVAADRAVWQSQVAELKAIHALHKQEIAELKAMQKQSKTHHDATSKQSAEQHKEAQTTRAKNSPTKAAAQGARNAR